MSIGLRRFCFFSGGPIGLSGAFRLFDPDPSDDDDMVEDWILVLVAYGVRQTPCRLWEVWDEGVEEVKRTGRVGVPRPWSVYRSLDLYRWAVSNRHIPGWRAAGDTLNTVRDQEIK
jgi:hypothetical protein